MAIRWTWPNTGRATRQTDIITRLRARLITREIREITAVARHSNNLIDNISDPFWCGIAAGLQLRLVFGLDSVTSSRLLPACRICRDTSGNGRFARTGMVLCRCGLLIYLFRRRHRPFGDRGWVRKKARSRSLLDWTSDWT